MPTLTVTAKGQITLKQELLRHLNVSPGQKVQAEKLPDGRIIVQADKPTGSISDFSGFLHKPGRKPLTIDEINEATADAWAGKR
jgi:bifunctional DNA-binding transcriptional regulator/antitoxin component of YhaV-PrlF toxin-antitoxin module